MKCRFRWSIALALGLGSIPESARSQQVPDTLFHPPVAAPAYRPGQGPVVRVDEAHHNFHTAVGRYRPFAQLLERDGYVVQRQRSRFTKGSLDSCRILVIANAISAQNESEWTLPTPSAFDPAEIRTAVAAGAELVLSVNGSNIEAARELGGGSARVVVIPDFGEDLASLDRNIEALERWRVPFLIDPIIEPIGFGFMASLERYAETHRRYPEAGQLMGVGNITELTSADSTGVNAILLAIAEELGVRAVLTTEVTPWARGAVREIDVARRLMHHAVTHRTLPKGVDDRLLTVKDAVVLEYSEEELRQLHASVKDGNFRIFADRHTITVFNNERFVRGTDIQAIFAQLGVEEATHAFYLGRELMKAKLAITLGKTYRQEGALAWGYLTPPDDIRSEHVKLTQRRRRPRTKSRRTRDR